MPLGRKPSGIFSILPRFPAVQEATTLLTLPGVEKLSVATTRGARGEHKSRIGKN
jgi:hypothetical protein